MKQILCAATLLFCASCALPQVKSVHSAADQAPTTLLEPQATQPAANAWESTPTRQPVLYSRDGSPVSAQQPGTVAVSPNTGQSAGERDGSRWTLLEQYQAAVTAKEDLEFEVNALGVALDQAEALAAQQTQSNDELRSQMALYEERISALKNENVDLAARLTTAQVRRLQSEKLLLEAKLDWKRVEAVLNQPESISTTMSSSPGPAEAGPLAPATKQQP